LVCARSNRWFFLSVVGVVLVTGDDENEEYLVRSIAAEEAAEA